jgi:phage major head subunit gpT-like protein
MLFTIANSANIEAARVGFHAAFLEQLGQSESNPLLQAFNEVSSSAGIEEWDWLGDVPDFEEWKGDRFLADLEAFKLRLVNKDWASGIRVHQNQIKDDKLNLIQPKIAQLAQKARTHKIRLMVKLLINGFDGLAYPDVGNGLAYDGKFFFDATRATGSNKMTAAFDLAGLEAAELLLQSQVNYSGDEPLALTGTHIIVGPKNQAAALRIIGQEYLTGGESNYMKGRYEVVVHPLLRGAYDDYWFLADLSEPVKPFVFQNREDITTSAVVGDKGGSNDSVPRFQRGELWFGAEARYNVGYFEPRLMVGSVL